MMITIRQAEKNDAALLLRFIRELAEYEKLGHEVVATQALLEETIFGEQAHAEAVIAEKDEVPVGFCLFFYTFSTFLGRPGLYIEDLYVQPELRGEGVGQKLLEYITELADAKGCGRVEWSVLDWNAPAIDFYKKIGAKPREGWTTFRLLPNAWRGKKEGVKKEGIKKEDRAA